MVRYVILICLLSCEPKKQTPRLSVTIDDTSYGAFEVYRLETFDVRGLPIKDDYSVIRLSRHFISELSLYRWAWKTKIVQSTPTNISLSNDSDRMTLIGCLPLSWKIEVAPEGGYYEQVDVTALQVVKN